ncbi:MAG: FHA domain-containing protein, partial [Planctomycetota bacterium]
MPTLRVVKGHSTAEQFDFEEEIRLGRAAENGIRIFDEAASRHHAVVRREGSDFVAEDCRSTNGLFVNGRRVERSVLRTGDEISVRGLTLVFVGAGAPERSTVVVEAALEVQSRLEPSAARVGGAEEGLLARLAALSRVTGLVAGDRGGLRAGLLQTLQEAFAPCRAALVLPEGAEGAYSRSLVAHVRTCGEALVVRDPPVETR